jgi:hypothetical protein
MANSFKRFFYQIGLIFSFFAPAFANDQETFLKARQFYCERNFQRALEFYRSIENKGDAVWFNSGACLAAMQKNAEALSNWYRARKEAHFQTLPVIDAAISSLEQPYNPPRSLMAQIWCSVERVSLLFSLGTWQMLILFMMIGIIFLAVLAPMGYKKIFTLMFVCLSILSCIAYARHELKTKTFGFILRDQAAIKIGPADSFEDSCALSYGSKVEILQNERGWYKIRHHTCAGWLKEQEIALAF